MGKIPTEKFVEQKIHPEKFLETKILTKKFLNLSALFLFYFANLEANEGLEILESRKP